MTDDALRADVLPRLRTIHGQDRYCVAVRQQVDAARSALEAVGQQVARNHLERCVTDAVKPGGPLVSGEVMRVGFRNR